MQTHIITDKESLTLETLRKIDPEYVFLPHWSWLIPKEIFQSYECIGFHIGDLPKGRGGSPLQNHIINKTYNTNITAFRIDEGIDAGDIYLKEDLYIGVGTAEEIFIRVSEIIFFKMIPYVIQNKPNPYKQVGEATIYRRRKPEDSNLACANLESLSDFYDFIRMLNAEGYPKAFLRLNNFKIVFSEPVLKHGKLVGRFEILESCDE
ncbi:MAG: formyltransferase family protein [Bacteroidia bacterium]|nr:formyltransferase family protein [Bacteroidia bacterium]